jgi:DNA-binding transcriptional ArsR family regulator
VAEVDWEVIARNALHPTRLRIIERAAAHPNERFSPVGLAAELKQPLPNVSYHVRALANEGLLARAGTVSRRGAVEHFYRASRELLRDARRSPPNRRP